MIKIIIFYLIYLCYLSHFIYANEICDILNKSTILAQDNNNTFLGKVENRFSSESIFNEYGTYGSEYNSNSIWNKYGTYGSEYNQYSPFNIYSSKPPIFVKNGKIIGYLSTNEYIESSISPNLLKALCANM